MISLTTKYSFYVTLYRPYPACSPPFPPRTHEHWANTVQSPWFTLTGNGPPINHTIKRVTGRFHIPKAVCKIRGGFSA